MSTEIMPATVPVAVVPSALKTDDVVFIGLFRLAFALHVDGSKAFGAGAIKGYIELFGCLVIAHG